MQTIEPTPEQIDALAFELHTMGVQVPPHDTAFFHAAVRKWLAGAGLNNRWQDMASFPSDPSDVIWLCKGNSVDGPRTPQIDDSDIYEWWCSAEPPALPTAK